jgi:hypothetical protein
VVGRAGGRTAPFSAGPRAATSPATGEATGQAGGPDPTPDRVREAPRPFGPTVLRTNLTKDREEELVAALRG